MICKVLVKLSILTHSLDHQSNEGGLKNSVCTVTDWQASLLKEWKKIEGKIKEPVTYCHNSIWLQW